MRTRNQARTENDNSRPLQEQNQNIPKTKRNVVKKKNTSVQEQNSTSAKPQRGSKRKKEIISIFEDPVSRDDKESNIEQTKSEKKGKDSFIQNETSEKNSFLSRDKSIQQISLSEIELSPIPSKMINETPHCSTPIVKKKKMTVVSPSQEMEIKNEESKLSSQSEPLDSKNKTSSKEAQNRIMASESHKGKNPKKQTKPKRPISEKVRLAREKKKKYEEERIAHAKKMRAEFARIDKLKLNVMSIQEYNRQEEEAREQELENKRKMFLS